MLVENATTPWGQSWERVPGHPELTANKMAKIWNNMNLSNAKSIACTRAFAFKWYQKNPKISI